LLSPQHLGGGEPGGAAADDHDSIRAARRGARFGARPCALLADEKLSVALLHRPGIQRAESRRTNGFAGAEVEAGVMPGAADGAVDNEPVDKGAMIMGAVGSDGECVGSLPRQQHLFVPDMTDQLAAIRELGERQTLRQIGTGLIFRHSALLEQTLDVTRSKAMGD